MGIFRQIIRSLQRVPGLFRRHFRRHYRVECAGFVVFSPAGYAVLKIGVLAETGSSTELGEISGLPAELQLLRQEDTPPGPSGTIARRLKAGESFRHYPDGKGRVMPGVCFRQDHRTGFVPLVLRVAAPDIEVFSVTLPRAGPGKRLIATLRTSAGFGRALLISIPAVLHWVWHGSDAGKQRIKNILGLAPGGNVLPLNDGAFQPAEPDRALSGGRTQCAGAGVDVGADVGAEILVILPVYNAFAVLPECLRRVCDHTHGGWRLLVIDDCSTDPRVRPWLHAQAKNDPRISIVENPANFGFTGTANRGFKLAKTHSGPVLLLNSDAFLPMAWDRRLLAPLRDTAVASVMPLSNDAEIFNVPVACVRRTLNPGEADRLDAVLARRVAAMPAHMAGVLNAEVPAGVGFCLALSSDWLRRAGGFDPAFGRGYGEEVDWCQRVRALGGRHIGCGALFVEHRGGESFGKPEKQRLIAEHGALVSKRHRGFDQDVQEFLNSDPLLTARLQAAIALAAIKAEASADPAHQALQVWIGHSLGGGADHWLRDQIAREITQGRDLVVLRVGSLQGRWRVELHCPEGITAGWSNCDQTLRTLLDVSAARHIRCSNGVGHPDPAAFCALVQALSQRRKDRLTLYCHDHYMLSPSYTLLNSSGQYCGVPPADDPDPAHVFHTAGGPVALPRWRQMWGEILASADAIICFSENTRTLLSRAYPRLNHPAERLKIRLRPHVVTLSPPRVRARTRRTKTPPKPAAVTIAVPGNINFAKGAQVVATLAQAQKPFGLRLMVIGNMAPDTAVSRCLKIHGDYVVADLPRLTRHYNIRGWLIPSIWPETFSFTTHEALASGLPVFGFDLGAQGDALRAASNGYLLPAGCENPDVLLHAICGALAAEQPRRSQPLSG